jgi:hypothetical protein
MANEVVSKANIYSTLIPADGAGVSKANLYAVLVAAPHLAISKANLYAVLISASGVRPVVQVCG